MQALFDLENTHQELKSDLKDLYINSARWSIYYLEVSVDFLVSCYIIED